LLICILIDIWNKKQEFLHKKNMPRVFSNVIGFDDGPFPSGHKGEVKIVGTVYAKSQFNGVLIGEVQRDGSDAAAKLTELISKSKFAESIQLIMLQGIALAGFNVVDVFELHEKTKLPVLVVCRKQPDMDSIRDALLQMPGGKKKWALIEKLGPMEPAANVYIQRVGLAFEQAETVVKQFTHTGNIPEPLRVAHMIAGAIVNGESSGRA
jgi:endonuclease V-like protein UPF0215 family